MKQDNFFYFKIRLRQRWRYLFKRFSFSLVSTKFFGYRFKRDAEQVNIILTNQCHRKCIDCSQYCTQAPSIDKMTIAQIKKFVDQCIESEKKWRRIRITGGEPTLDPDLQGVFNELKRYLKFSPKTQVMLLTNGYGDVVKQRLKKVPSWVTIINTNKTTSYHPYFQRTTVAAVDLDGYEKADFKAGCYALRTCALAVTKNGYYPCGHANGVDRIFGFNLGRKSLPSDDDSMREILDKTCRYCGYYVYYDPKVEPGFQSKSWQKAIKQYTKKPPELDDL
jgi:hypothetical protein